MFQFFKIGILDLLRGKFNVEFYLYPTTLNIFYCHYLMTIQHKMSTAEKPKKINYARKNPTNACNDII